MMDKTNFTKVKEFHELFDVDINKKIHTSSKSLVELRLNLIREEIDEFEKEVYKDHIKLENLSKELADVLYVVYGFAVTFGIPIDDVFEEVHRSNLTKLDDNGKPLFREDGKILKSKNYEPADVKKILEEKYNSPPKEK
jgi:predicted HAD superfamily Cof-like phosphohydrolase